jgi:hypothetical protein
VNKKKKIALSCCLGFLLGPPLVLFGGGVLMSREAKLSTEADLSMPAAKIDPVLSTQAGIQKWWGAVLPKTGGGGMAVVALDGPASGVGARVGFKVGEELVEDWVITGHEPGKSVTYLVDFQVFKVTRTITLTPTENGTHATWVEIADFENPLLRWFTLLPVDEKEGHMKVALQGLDAAAKP